MIQFGNKVEGHVCSVEKEGKGCVYFAYRSILKGRFINSYIEGMGTYMFPDSSYLKGTYSSGDLNGPCRQYDCRGIGFVKMFDEFDGTGSSVAYVYPDGVTALVGELSSGRMVHGRPAKLKSDRE